MASGLACGNNTDEFDGPRVVTGMNDNQQNQSLGEANSVPPLFAVLGSLDESDASGIVEGQLGSLKIDAVLDEVALVLVLVPFETQHAYVQIGTYEMQRGDFIGLAKGDGAGRISESRQEPRRRGIDKSVDTASRSACATVESEAHAKLRAVRGSGECLRRDRISDLGGNSGDIKVTGG